MNSNKTMILPLEITKQIQTIQTDSQSGATELTKKGIHTLKTLLTHSKTTDKNQLYHQIKQTVLQLIKAQPMMASFISFANNILLSIETQNPESIQSLKKLVFTTSNTFLNTFSQANKHISTHTLHLLTDNTTVFTYSNSSSVTTALLYAHQKGRKINVYCSESQPTKEGTQLAETLSRHGINTNLSTDAALFSQLPKADLIFIGADSISKQGLSHKIGTNALASLARYHQIPLYSLSAEEKIIPLSYKLPNPQPKDPKEILTKKHESLTISNYYFDNTPISLFTAIITQKGKQQPKDIYQQQNNLSLHQSLQT